MFSAFTVKRQLLELLKEAQTPGTHEFELLDSIDLYGYNPGDCMVTGYAPSDGLYVFLHKTKLFPEHIAPGEQFHSPSLMFYLYCSSPANAQETSIEAVNAKAEEVSISLYNCIMHTTFRRVLEDKFQAADPALTDENVPRFRYGDFENSATYPIMDNSRATIFWKASGVFDVTELPGQAATRLVNGDNRLHTVREEDDI